MFSCVRVGNEVSEWFPVRVELRQGMSPWLFHRVLGRGLKLVDGVSGS